jgi:hypothetical protein
MIIELSKNIYCKDSVFNAKNIWKDYFSKIEINQDKDNFILDAETKEDNPLIFKEFLNYILDLNIQEN